MAGYVFLLNDLAHLDKLISNGVYSTNMNDPTGGYWSISMEGTIADYMTMKEGDSVYFFSKRKIYGIGEIIKINNNNVLQNFPDAILPVVYNYTKIRKQLLLDTGPDSVKNRLVCGFKPAPYFFKNGVDMDDVLSSAPEKFKMLRLIQQVSFIKIDDQENQSIKDVILKRSINALLSPGDENIFKSNYQRNHQIIISRVTPSHEPELNRLLEKFSNTNGALNHEMLVESAILNQISLNHKATIRHFGKWDYLSHQVGASPFKPIIYMDRMDIFGYSYIPKFSPTIQKYLVIEIKKDIARKVDLNQLMKYVDWIKNEYASHDYTPIHAFLVSNSFEDEIEKEADKIVIRNFTYGNRPTVPASWANLKLVKYSFSLKDKALKFKVVKDFNFLLK